MKFTISSTELLKHLRSLQTVISRKNTLPILDNFLFEAAGGTLTVTASDLETTMSVKVPCECKTEGSVTIPAKTLVNALRAFPSQHLKFATNKADLITIATEQGKYEIRGYSHWEYPKTNTVENPTEFTIPASVLVKAIVKTLPMCGHDDMRPVMSGVLFEGQAEGMRFVSTDAHRMIKYDRVDVAGPGLRSFIVAKRTLRTIQKHLGKSSGDVSVSVGEHSISFAIAGTYIYARLIDGKYPNYEAVFPAEAPVKLTVGRMALLACVNRMYAFTGTITRQMVFDITSGVVVSAENLDDDTRATEKLTCQHEGGAFRIGFNAGFLSDILKTMTCDEVVIAMAAPNRAVTIAPTEQAEGEALTTLVMPVMLNDMDRRAA